MRTDNIQWQPVRIRSERLGNRDYRLYRGELDLGRVRYERGRWRVYAPGKYQPTSERSSFRAACLLLARSGADVSSDGPQDYGPLHMIRISCQTVWYTVLFDGPSTYIYEDFTIPSELHPVVQSRLRAVVAEAERWRRKKNL